MGYPKMYCLWWKILLKWMIWRHPYFRKPPSTCEHLSMAFSYKTFSLCFMARISNDTASSSGSGSMVTNRSMQFCCRWSMTHWQRCSMLWKFSFIPDRTRRSKYRILWYLSSSKTAKTSLPSVATKPMSCPADVIPKIKGFCLWRCS